MEAEERERDAERRARRVEMMLRSELGAEFLAALADATVTDVSLNGDGILWLRRLGGTGWESFGTLAPQRAEAAIKTIADMIGTTVSRSNPFLSDEFPLDGSRLQVVLPPAADQPTLVLRKHASQVFTLDTYVERGILSQRAAGLLRRAIHDRVNIVVSGGTGSGKTTFLNALLHEIAKYPDRLFVLEDTKELQPTSKNQQRLYATRMPGGVTVTMRDLLFAALRMMPDRIVLGEIRDGATAMELLKMWNTGHPGGLATVHADSALDTFYRFHDLITEAGGVPVPARIASTIGYVVYIEQRNGRREVKEMVRVDGYRDGTYQLTPVA
jgi:type IV secretion system protein VirB11